MLSILIIITLTSKLRAPVKCLHDITGEVCIIKTMLLTWVNQFLITWLITQQLKHFVYSGPSPWHICSIKHMQRSRKWNIKVWRCWPCTSSSSAPFKHKVMDACSPVVNCSEPAEMTTITHQTASAHTSLRAANYVSVRKCYRLISFLSGVLRPGVKGEVHSVSYDLV